MQRFFVVVAALCVCAVSYAGSAQAAERTGLSFTVSEFAAQYSQAVNLELAFVDKDGDALDGTTACGANPCRVEVEIRVADNSAPAFDVTAPDVAVDAAGRARVRLTLVDGRHGGATFKAAPDPGLDYTLTARFRGVGAPLPDNDDEDCVDGAPGTDDGRLCPATATATVAVTPEVPALTFNSDVVLDLGDSVVLAASLEDNNGDADIAGTDVDGPGPKVLQGFVIRFAYDADDDGSPNFITERIGDPNVDVVTNAAGVASIEFVADPAFAQAGVYDAGLHAEFPGDDRYTVARSSVKLTLIAGGPDPAQTVVEVDPGTLPADGASEATIRVRLVDENGNLLGPEAPPHEVSVTSTLGVLIDEMARDPLDGTYTQQLRVQRKGGNARIEATVDGVKGGEAVLVIDGPTGGCNCNGTSPSASLVFALSLLALRPTKKKKKKNRG